MPPRLTLPHAPTPLSTQSNALLPALLKPSQQCRYASILGSISDTAGAYHKRIRRGRGPASGKGKTSGRGHGGQKQHGKVPAGFNGGQTKDEVVHGKRGFENQFSVEMTKINLDRVQSWIDQGRLDTTKPITIREIHRSRLTHGIKDGVKLLARNANELRTPIHITVSRASASAIAAIEAIGGTVQTRYYTKASIRRILQGETHPTLSLLSQPPDALPPASPITPAGTAASPSDTPRPQSSNSTSTPDAQVTHASNSLYAAIRQFKYRLPDPASRKDLEYYRDPAHRGYLSYQLKEGEGPSLFFKSPHEVREGLFGGKKRVKVSKSAENKLW